MDMIVQIEKKGVSLLAKSIKKNNFLRMLKIFFIYLQSGILGEAARLFKALMT